MAQRMRSGPHIEPGLFPVVSHQELNAAHRERTMVAILEQGRGRRGGQTPSGVEGEQLANAGLSLVVERHHTAPGSFANGRGKMEKLPGLAIARDEVNDEPRALADTEGCVIRERDEQGIAPAERACKVDGIEKLPELGFG